MIRGQLTEFCGRSTYEKRKRLCFPGIGVDGIIAARDDVVTESNENSLFIIHVGTNDVKANRSEEMMEKYCRLIKQFKEKTNNAMISGTVILRLTNVRLTNFWFNVLHKFRP